MERDIRCPALPSPAELSWTSHLISLHLSKVTNTWALGLLWDQAMGMRTLAHTPGFSITWSVSLASL